MTFNVGEIWSDEGSGGVYVFDDSTNVTLNWSGCSSPHGQPHLCNYSGYTPPYNRTVNVTVTINGASKTYSITADDRREDTSGGGDIN